MRDKTHSELHALLIENLLDGIFQNGDLITVVKISLPPTEAERWLELGRKQRPLKVHVEFEVLATEYCQRSTLREYMLAVDDRNACIWGWGFATQSGVYGLALTMACYDNDADELFEIPRSMRDEIADTVRPLLLEVLRKSGLPAYDFGQGRQS